MLKNSKKTVCLLFGALAVCSAYIESCNEDNNTDEIIYQQVNVDGNTENILYNHDNDIIDEALAETSIFKRREETIDPKSQKVANPTPDSREMKVTFANKSGKKAKLWWKGFDNQKVLQANMDINEQMVINTFFGHEFFFTSFDNEDKKLYSVRMESHIDNIELLTPEEMSKRNNEFQQEKNNFMKNYYEQTGRRWKNYYPRPPVKHFVYNIEQQGQILSPHTNAAQYRACPQSLYQNEEFVNILNRLETKENEYIINEFNELNEERLAREANNTDDRNWFHHVPAYNAFEEYYINNDNNYKILRYNGTIFCQDQNEDDFSINMSVLCTEPRVVSIPTFLSEEECDHVIQVGHYLGLRRSTVSESALKSQDRTSSTVWLERKMSPIIDNIVQRVADAVGIDESLLYLNASSESLQFVHYLDGELYRPHVDYGTDAPNNRFITFLMYLNNVNEGGYTSFPNADLSCKNEDDYFGVKPIRGSAAWFYDLFSDGNVDPKTLHFAEPPTNGSQKFMTNLWIWDPFFK